MSLTSSGNEENYLSLKKNCSSAKCHKDIQYSLRYLPKLIIDHCKEEKTPREKTGLWVKRNL